jgi:23S rRNA (uracil1939-C5)-methyltransferase
VTPQPLRRGDLVDVAIEKGVYRGRGLGRVDGRVVLVSRALPGERVRARVASAHAGYAEADLVDVLEPSPERRPAPCPHAGDCGGCAYQPLAPEAQVRLKEAILRESLARAGARFDGPVATTASAERGWRTRASLHFAVAESGALTLGFRREGTRHVVPALGCLQLSETMARAARSLRDALATRGASLARALRGLELLEAPDGTALVATLDTVLDASAVGTLEPLGRATPGLTGFGVRAGDGRTRWLHGDPHVEATILGLRLRAHAAAFFQGNRFLLEPLARDVVALVPEGEAPVLDLYAGVGLFALPLAARGAPSVAAVEGSAAAAEDARWNASRSGLAGRVRVVRDDVARALAAMPARTGEAVVLDPPRAGAGPGVVDAIAAREPSVVVYVSCDPPTLGRDLARFGGLGYAPDTMHLFDLFPDTFHMETVVRLRPSVTLRQAS